MPLSPAELARRADGFVQHARTRADADFWAWDAVGEVVRGPDPDTAWDLVQALIARVPLGDAALIGSVAAGPVEDLVVTHGTALVDRITGEARRNPHFRAHLAGIWLTRGALPPEVETRLVAASGGAIEPIEPGELPDDDARVGLG